MHFIASRASGKALQTCLRHVCFVVLSASLSCGLAGAAGCDRGAHEAAQRAATRQQGEEKIRQTVDERKTVDVRLDYVESELATSKTKFERTKRELDEARGDETQLLIDIERNGYVQGASKEALRETTPVGVPDPTYTGYRKAGFNDIGQSMKARLDEVRTSIKKSATLLEELGGTVHRLEEERAKLVAERESLRIELDRLTHELVRQREGKK